MDSDDEIIKINIKNYILKKIDDEKVKEICSEKWNDWNLEL